MLPAEGEENADAKSTTEKQLEDLEEHREEQQEVENNEQQEEENEKQQGEDQEEQGKNDAERTGTDAHKIEVVKQMAKVQYFKVSKSVDTTL